MGEPVSEILARNPVLLAPMAGVTEAPFRGICKQLGAGLTYTEMISVNALHYHPNNRRTMELLRFDPDELPCALQVYGADPEIMATQTARLVDHFGDAFCLVDVNMGCPVTKIVARGEGSALMRDPAKAAAVISALVDAVSLPITAKIRSGWDDDEINAAEVARALEDAGASAVAVHGRTRMQFYKGHSDRGVIAQVKQAVSIPVIASGDVFSARDVADIVDETGVDAVMVARGARGYPWIFREANALLAGGPALAPPTALERVDLALEHARLLHEFTGEHSFVRIRKHVAWYIADMPGATFVRDAANHAHTYDDVKAILVEYRERLVEKGAS